LLLKDPGNPSVMRDGQMVQTQGGLTLADLRLAAGQRDQVSRADHFAERDLELLQFVAYWLGQVQQ
jgi:hypothetical protein